MNCPSRTDEVLEHDGSNQNPPSLTGDLITRADLNGISNSRLQRDHLDSGKSVDVEISEAVPDGLSQSSPHASPVSATSFSEKDMPEINQSTCPAPGDTPNGVPHEKKASLLQCLWPILIKYTKFIGPGFMVSVAYIDPGNYSTDVAAGASTKFKLLFIVLMSNIFAVVLQTLAVRLGTVTGMDLAQSCRAYLPRWLNLFLYVMAEAAIITTDIAEVIGSAIALNLLIKIPLVGGCALTIVDVILILLFYNPQGSLRRLRFFECFVVALVLGVAICFCIQLSLITDTTVGEVFKGYLPSPAVIRGQGIYLSCGILGATVMPHGLYLGSGIVQSRLRAFDIKAGNHITQAETAEEKVTYVPTIAAIKSCLNYSIVELILSLTIFALFVNSAILIVAGASLSTTSGADSADLFGIHDLLAKTIAPVAGTIFGLALLLSGTSAGIVCTIAGQIVSEGALNWTIAPWLRRLLTRSISIVPSIIIAGSVGRDGLSAALNGTQVALSVILPFTSAPLIYFTCRNRFMTVHPPERGGNEEADESAPVEMRNHRLLSVFAVCVWLVITIMNVAFLVLLGLGKT